MNTSKTTLKERTDSKIDAYKKLTQDLKARYNANTRYYAKPSTYSGKTKKKYDTKKKDKYKTKIEVNT